MREKAKFYKSNKVHIKTFQNGNQLIDFCFINHLSEKHYDQMYSLLIQKSDADLKQTFFNLSFS